MFYGTAACCPAVPAETVSGEGVLKPASFKYFAPATLEEAVQLMAEHGSDARPLAGGQSLVALMNTRLIQPAVIIDLGRCSGIDGIHEAEGGLTLPAMVRQAVAERSPAVARHCPLLAEALPHVGETAHRNRGTVCGSLAHADPLAELPCAALALDARFTLVSSRGRREVMAADFFQGPLSTALDADELLESVTFPKSPANARAAFLEVGRNRHHGFAIVGVGVQVEFDDDGACSTARIAAMGLGDVPVRLRELEGALQGRDLTSTAVQDLAGDCARWLEARSDIHASSEYRLAMTATLVRRALLGAYALQRDGEPS